MSYLDQKIIRYFMSHLYQELIPMTLLYVPFGSGACTYVLFRSENHPLLFVPFVSGAHPYDAAVCSIWIRSFSK